jgi:membrane dipeptidase
MVTFRADLHAHPGRSMQLGFPADHPLVVRSGGPTTDAVIEELRAARLNLVSFATVADMPVLRAGPAGMRSVRDFEPGEAYRDHRRQLDGLLATAATAGVPLARSAADLATSPRDGTLAMLVAIEGGDFLEGRLERVEEAYRDGVRSIQLVHYRTNELGDIQTAEPVHGGLTPFGAGVVAELNRLGMLVDLAHAPWSVTRDALERATAPVMISHSHLATGDPPHPRLLAVEHARAVAEGGGLIGAWPSGMALDSFDAYLDEIARMVELLGVDHVAIGTDMDGNYRPVMTRYAQYVDLEAGLRDRGFDAPVLAAVLGDNLRHLWNAVEAAARPPDA